MTNLQKIRSAAPAAAQRMRNLGIPEKIITDTFADIDLWAAWHKEHYGYEAITERANEWLQLHINCKVFRVGRFQCEPRLFSERGNARFFRNNKTGELTAITAGEVTYRNDGQVSGTSGIHEDGFRSYFCETAETVEGLFIDPKGHATNKATILNKNEWTEVLKAGMPVFSLHIPADGGFDWETIRKSLTDMIDFAKTHQSAIEELTGVQGPFTAFSLSSWLLDAQLDGILPETSKLVQHLRQYYLIPFLCEGYNDLFFIFGDKKIDSIQPQDIKTTLQRNILKFIQDGGRTRANTGVILF